MSASDRTEHPDASISQLGLRDGVEDDRDGDGEENDLRSRLEIARTRKAAFESLIKCSGWSMLREIIEEGVKRRTDQVMLLPTGEELSQSQQEFMKGEVSAYRTLMAIPQSLIESDKDLIDQLQMMEGYENE